MYQTKGAIGNLINRYRAVLKKCHLLNTFGSLAVAGMLVMGTAGVAQAADDVALGGVDTTYTPDAEIDHLVGGWFYPRNGVALLPEGSDPVDRASYKLTIKSDQPISEFIAGSYVQGPQSDDDYSVILGDITTTIANDPASGTTQYVIGGSKISAVNAANVVTNSTSLIIESGTFGTNGGEYSLVIGGNYIKTMYSATDNTAEVTESSSVVVKDGTFYATVVGGSVAQTWHESGWNDATPSLAVTDGSTSLTVNGGTFNASTSTSSNEKGGIELSAALIGGGVAYGDGTSSVIGKEDGTSVIISEQDGKEIEINGKVVAGSVVVGASTAFESEDPTAQATIAGDTSLVMDSGTANDDLIGGSMIDSRRSDATGSGEISIDGSSSVTVSGGTVNGEVIGGNYVRGAGEATVASSSVTITGGIFTNENISKSQYIVGGDKVNVSADETGSATNGASSVTIQGDTEFEIADAVVGGSVAKAGGNGSSVAKAEVTSSTVTVNAANATIAGVIGGSVSETYGKGTSDATSTTGTSSVVIESGTVETIKAGATSETYADLGAAVVGGSLAVANNGTTSTSTVDYAETTITGDAVINGNVVAASYAAGSGASVAIEEGTTTAVVNIEGGTIEGDVYAGGAAVKGGEAGVVDVTANITGGTITGTVIAGNLTDDEYAAAADDSEIDITIAGDADVKKGVVLATNDSEVTIGDSAIVSENDDNNAVYIAENTDGATVILEGTETTITGKFTSEGTDSTLAFSEYEGTFGNTFTCFDTLGADAASHVTITNLSTASNGKDLTLVGDGEFVSDTVTVADNALTVGDGQSATRLTINESLSVNSSQTMSVENAATVAVNADTYINGQIQLNAGSTLEADLGESISVSDYTTWKNEVVDPDSAGLVNLLDTEITGLEDIDGLINEDDGHYVYSKLSDTIGTTTNNDLLTKIVDVTSNDEPVSGGFKSVHLTDNNNELVASGSLTLAGDTSNSKLIWSGDADPDSENATLGSLRIGASGGSPDDTSVTLGRLDADNSGQIGNITMSVSQADNIASLSLNVYGKNKDNSQFTVGTIYGGNNSIKTINVIGSTLITDSISPTEDDGSAITYSPIDYVNITDGAIAANGVVYVVNVTLNNGSLTADKVEDEYGNITINGTLSGTGSVEAAGDLTLNDDYTGSEDDDITLKGTDVTTQGLDSSEGKGTISIVAEETLTTNGEVSLYDDSVTAGTWVLADGSDGEGNTVTGSLTAAGSTVIRIDAFGISGEETETSTLDKAVSIEDQSILVHGDKDYSLADIAAIKEAAGHDGSTYVAVDELVLAEGGSLTVGVTDADTEASGSVQFGSDSLLVVDNNALYADSEERTDATLFTSKDSGAGAYVSEDSKLYIINAQYEDNFTVFDGFSSADKWTQVNMVTDTDMLTPEYDGDTQTIIISVNDAHDVFPGLSDDLAPAVNDLYTGKLNNVDSEYEGIKFLSRATNNRFLGSDKAAAASTIESAARIAFAGAVPQMTKMASDAATNAVVNRLGIANPGSGVKAMDAEGRLVDDKVHGFALWIAPLWQNQSGFGMEAGNLDYGYNANLGGVSIGADYTFDNAIRAGIMFNIGGGYAESSGGDLSDTTNSMTFWGREWG